MQVKVLEEDTKEIVWCADTCYLRTRSHSRYCEAPAFMLVLYLPEKMDGRSLCTDPTGITVNVITGKEAEDADSL